MVEVPVDIRLVLRNPRLHRQFSLPSCFTGDSGFLPAAIIGIILCAQPSAGLGIQRITEK